MSKKRKKIEISEEEISYVTLKDGTKIVEPVYLSVVTTLKSFASGADGLFGGIALYDIYQKAFDPDYEMYSSKAKELLKGFIEEDGRLNDGVISVVKNILSYQNREFSFNDGLKEAEPIDQDLSAELVESSKNSTLEKKAKSKDDDEDSDQQGDNTPTEKIEVEDLLEEIGELSEQQQEDSVDITGENLG